MVAIFPHQSFYNHTASSIADLLPSELISWLRLVRTPNVGPVAFFDLMSYSASPEEALELLPTLALHGGKTAVHIPTKADAEKEIEALTKLGGKFVAYGTHLYPRHLLALHDAPPLLAVVGATSVLTRTSQMIAMVGSRNASLMGKRLAHQLAKDMSQEEWPVVSGLARGIDTEVHYGSLENGTIAVLGTGVDVPYPRENKVLYDVIIDRGGCIVSELPIGSQPLSSNFPRRNRIIAGMTMGVVVVEATLHSGSLITARYALDYGRDVFSVPGSPYDPRCHGTNDLLRHGATLVESAKDIFDAYAYRTHQPVAEAYHRPVWGRGPSLSIAPQGDMDKLRVKVLEAINSAPVSIDALVEATTSTTMHITRVLLELELAGRVERLPGGRVALLPAP